MASLVVQTSFLGDVILTTPLIVELAGRGPVDVIATADGAAVLANHPAVRNVIVYDKRGDDRGMSGFARIVGRIRDAGPVYEDAYMAQGSVRSATLAVAAGIRRRIGFQTSAGRILYSERVQYRSDRHHSERLWWLSMSDCADPPNPEQIAPSLFPGADDVVRVDTILDGFGGDGSREFVVLAPGSAWGTKRWPFFPELAEKVAATHNVAIVGGNADVSLGESILARLTPGAGVNACGTLGILASAELIRRASALVTNDSAPQHLASAMLTPTVTVFGPTVPEFGFGPLAPRSAAAGLSSLACRPCDSHGPRRCPLGHWRCMRDLSPGSVLDILVKTLS